MVPLQTVRETKRPLSPPAAADRPSFSSGDTPSPFIQRDSCEFDGYQFLEASDSDAFSFGDGTSDKPFSVALWIKGSSSASFESLVTKSKGTAGNMEWAVYRDGDKKIHLSLY